MLPSAMEMTNDKSQDKEGYISCDTKAVSAEDWLDGSGTGGERFGEKSMNVSVIFRPH